MPTDAGQPPVDLLSHAAIAKSPKVADASEHGENSSLNATAGATAKLLAELDELRMRSTISPSPAQMTSGGLLDLSTDGLYGNRSKESKPPVETHSATNTTGSNSTRFDVSTSRLYSRVDPHDTLPQPGPFNDLQRQIENQFGLISSSSDSLQTLNLLQNALKGTANLTHDQLSSFIKELPPEQLSSIFGVSNARLSSETLALNATSSQVNQVEKAALDAIMAASQQQRNHGGDTSRDGSNGEARHHSDHQPGRVELLTDKDVVAEREKLRKLAERLPEAERRWLEQYIQDFELRAKNGKLDPKEVANTYKQIERLLQPSGDKPIAQSEKDKLAIEVMRHAAHPQDISQGGYNTCNVCTVETRMYTRNPSDAARLVADVALTGQYTAADGTQVTVSPVAHFESTIPLPTPDGTRDHASEIFHVTAVNIHYAKENAKTKPPGQIRYVQLGQDDLSPTQRLHDNGERLMDYADPAHPKEVTDKNGKPLRQPNLWDNDICAISEAITGKHEKGMFLATQAGLAVLPGHEGDDRITIVNSEAALKERLKQAKANHEFPIIVQVYVANDPFYSDGGFGRIPDGGGSHVVTITNYEAGPPERVEMDNQWRKPQDHDMSVHDLFRAMNPPRQAIDLLQQDVDYNRAHNQIDYAKELELLALKFNQGMISEGQYEKMALTQIRDLKKHFEQDNPSQEERLRAMQKLAEVIAQAPADVQARLIQAELNAGLINRETFGRAVSAAGWQADHDYNHYSEKGEWLIAAWWRHQRQVGQLDETISVLPKDEQEAIRKKIDEFNKKYD